MRYAKLATIALLTAMLVAGMGCVDEGKKAYEECRELIEAAVAEFMFRPTDLTYNHTQGEVPIVNKTVIVVSGLADVPDEDYYIVAVGPLIMTSLPRGLLKWVPSTTHHRNCFPDGANAQLNVTDCAAYCSGSYLWLTTLNGDVASICIGEECEAHGEDGYQGVYP